MTSSGGKLIITIHILPNVSRSEANQTMDLGKLIEYNMGNIFLVKLCTKCVEKISPRPFSKKPKLSIPLDQQSVIL